MNTVPLFDKYILDNSEDELGRDKHSLDKPDKDDKTSEALFQEFIPHNNQSIEKGIQDITQSQCLSPRGFQHVKFHFKKQDVKTVTFGRSNTDYFPQDLPNDKYKHLECEGDQQPRGVGETQDAQEVSPFICYHYI